MKKLSTLLVGVALTLFASLALADDLNPPPWRGAVNTTYQLWDFPNNSSAPAPDVSVNPYGEASMYVAVGLLDPDHGWKAGVVNHEGVWSLSGLIVTKLPNRPQPNWEKWVWLQVTWQPTGGGTAEPLALLTSDIGDPELMEITAQTDLGDGWYHWTYVGCIPYNPPFEIVGLTGDIDVDQVVIDTWCIPESPTYGLIAGLGLLGFGIWRRLHG